MSRKIIWLACLLTACSSAPYVQRDAGPTSTIDLAAIPEVIPKEEPITSAGNKSPYTVLGKTYHVLPHSDGYIEKGFASWYGTKFHGRLTSNGEVYNMYELTAAHKSLPIPTYVRVRNLENNHEIIVRVNDRGPFHDERIIDLSWAAAAKLGFADVGIAPVQVTAIDPNRYQVELAKQSRPHEEEPVPAPRPLSDLDANSYLQVAALTDPGYLDDLLGELIPLVKQSILVVDEDTELGTIYRVQIGPITEKSELNLLQTMLELAGLQPGFVVSREACAQNC